MLTSLSLYLSIPLSIYSSLYLPPSAFSACFIAILFLFAQLSTTSPPSFVQLFTFTLTAAIDLLRILWLLQPSRPRTAVVIRAAIQSNFQFEKVSDTNLRWNQRIHHCFCMYCGHAVVVGGVVCRSVGRCFIHYSHIWWCFRCQAEPYWDRCTCRVCVHVRVCVCVRESDSLTRDSRVCVDVRLCVCVSEWFSYVLLCFFLGCDLFMYI